jgi:hypothetical protein
VIALYTPLRLWSVSRNNLNTQFFTRQSKMAFRLRYALQKLRIRWFPGKHKCVLFIAIEGFWYAVRTLFALLYPVP